MANIFDLFKQIEKKDRVDGGAPIEYIVAGLGNPGGKYEKTRHNAGFTAIDHIAQKCGVRIDRARFDALVGECTISGKRVLLVKPQTFMNLSGKAVGSAAGFYKVSADNIIVLSDDVTLDVGRLRARRKGSAGGHNGLKSINEHLGTELYPRIKIGVGKKPHPEYDLADWVLSELSAGDLKLMSSSFDALFAGLEKIIAGDFDGAMQICNGFTPDLQSQ